MKHTRFIVFILALALLLPCLPVAGHAADEIGFAVTVTPETTLFGGQATVTVSLTGYDTASIAGLQVDITGFDSDVMQVVEYTSLIEDNDGASNKATYSAEHNRVRLLYFRTSGTLAPCEDVLKLVVQTNPELTQAGSITLPVTVKIVTEDSQQITLTSSCTIAYAETIAAARNSTTGTEYVTVSEALAAARAGETVTVQTDCKENLILVPAGVTLDLKGCVVETGNVMSFGAVIDTAAKAGGIKIDIDTTKAFTLLQEENAGYLPIYDDDAGVYRFFAYELRNKGAKEVDGAAKFGISIIFDNPEAYRVLAATDNSGITLTTQLTWKDMTIPYVECTITPEKVREFAQKAYAQLTAPDNTRTETNYAFTLTVSGLNKLQPGDWIKASPAISTITGTGDSNDAIVYTIPDPQ